MAEPPFPPSPTKRWHWPRVPGSPLAFPSDDGSGQACHIETSAGEVIEGTLLGMDPSVGALKYRRRGDAWSVTLPFWRLRRLTLTTPIAVEPQPHLRNMGGNPSATHPCSYRLDAAEGGQLALTGRTAGYVRAREGIYLFSPVDGAPAVQRVFVPSSAYSAYKFGPSAEEAATQRGIATRAELLAAIAEQDRFCVEPLGQSLLKMGLLTQVQLNQALATQRFSHIPLGEMLVKNGIITRVDLQRALSVKMGYPLVDLVRFPIDPAAMEKLPLAVAAKARVAPLIMDGKRLIVAIDKPSRTVKLRQLQALSEMTLVPVMAPRNLILDVLTIMSEHGTWKGVPLSMRFFPTTA